MLGGALGAGTGLGRRNGAKWTNMEPKGYQKISKGGQNEAKGTQQNKYIEKVRPKAINKNKTTKKHKKRSVPGRPDSFEGLGPFPLCSGLC